MKIVRTVNLLALLLLTLPSAFAQTPTSKIVNAANAFLSTLSQAQRQNVLFAFDDAEQRVRWSNFPISIVPRKGMNLGELTVAQRSAVMTLLSTTLSPRGFEKVQQVMDGDEVLKTTNNTGPGGRGAGPRGDRGAGPPAGDNRRGRGPGGLLFGRDLYYISFVGTPSEKNPWILQFGGHHLAVNISIAGERGTLTPTLTGAQPALYTSNGKTIRPLGGESDKALTLLQALDENQRKQAILNYRVADLVLGPGQDGKTIQSEGLKASSMTARQRDMLLDIMSEWAGIVHETEFTTRIAELKADINDTWFAWSGPADTKRGDNITAYYRIQGPHVVIEYAPQQMGGDPAMHVHTMYRDPTNDYGRKYSGK